LRQTSQGFFQASKSLVRITQVLDASCNVSFSTCNALMQQLAVQLKQSNNCGTDFANNNPIVIQAYDGFIAYQPMFQAGCQKDDRGRYCEFMESGVMSSMEMRWLTSTRLCRCHHQHFVNRGLLSLLPPSQRCTAWRSSTDVQQVSSGHHGHLRQCCYERLTTNQRHIQARS
jgi:hypothetical protein